MNSAALDPNGGPGWYRSIGTHTPGPFDAITDVAGVKVGSVTLIEGEGKRQVGVGPVRTGVTVVIPSESIWRQPLQAGVERINGAGEVSGLEWIRESGLLPTPIGLTNTHSLGIVRDTIARIQVTEDEKAEFSLPVVGETCDIVLNDMHGQHVRPEHVEQAFAKASGGPVEQGAVGGGTGMICHGFKGGIGTASRLVGGEEGWTVGVLVQANHGMRSRLTIDGVPVGRVLGADRIPEPQVAPDGRATVASPGEGSIIVVLATDAPLMAPECAALAKRATFGIARTGGAGERTSGDFGIAFSTTTFGDDDLAGPTVAARRVSFDRLSPIYWAAIEATEQAIVNALLAAETMTGVDGNTVHGLPAEHLDSIGRSGG